MKVIIVGAGIGGLTTHIVCKRAGFEVEHYERQPELGPAGAGIVLWPNGTKILLALGLGEGLERIGHRLEVVTTLTNEGKQLSEVPVGELEQKLGAPVYPVSRTDLQALLLDAIDPSAFTLGAECVRVANDPSGPICSFANGKSATGDVIVGADGIHSNIRSAIAGDVAPRYSEMANWVVIMPNGGLHRPHHGLEFVGEGKRCGVLPIAGDRLYVGFAARMAKGAQCPPEGRKAQLRELFGTWPAPIPDLIEALEEGGLKYLEIHDLPPLSRWSDGSITLLGDAAHATVPTLGQGGCQAMEDAIWLPRCLGSTTLGAEDALRRYESKRRERAEFIVSSSRKKAESMHAMQPEVYTAYYAAMAASSVTATMHAQEQLLEEGPFG